MKIAPIVIASLVLSPLSVAAERKEKEVDYNAIRLQTPNLTGIRSFRTLDVVIIGNEERLGMKEEELAEFAHECFRQLFKGYNMRTITGRPVEGHENEFGTLNLTVETFPIALHIELRMGTFGSERAWKTNELRVSTNSSIRDARLLKSSVASMMARSALTLRKVQEK